MLFWTQLEKLHEVALNGDRETLGKLLGEAAKTCRTGDDNLDTPRLDLLAKMATSFDLDFTRPPSGSASPTERPTRQVSEADSPELPPISPQGRPGVSLVTCCMNRADNLVRALTSWLACQEISEIIVVDWSSDLPVQDSLREAGIDDARIRVIRVEDQPRWILSHAFNVGFRVASCERILKADADIVLDPAFFARNRLEPGHFIAGNWRVVDKDQAYVNGFFYLFKNELAAIGGFNEYITTYGWDDDDIYERLESHGAVRRNVDIDTLHHLPHSDEERIGSDAFTDHPDVSAQAELDRDTMHKIRTNRLLAHVMPYWDAGKIPKPFLTQETGQGNLVLRRANWDPHPVPAHIRADQEYYAMLEMTSWRLGQRVLGLEREQLERLLEKPFADLGEIDVEVALASQPGTNGPGSGGYLVVRIGPPGMVPKEGPTGQAFEALSDLARARGLTPVLNGPFAHLPENACTAARACVLVPDWQKIGAPDPVDVVQLQALKTRAPGQHFQISLDATTIAGLEAMALSAPALVQSRARLFVDAQHGLGNRLRAIGSAATIAEKSDREMVVVWQPDDHCNCRFGDLFDYDGAVIEESFVDRAAEMGSAVYNYMEVEPGAVKGAEIRVAVSGDIYARSAYVLNSPLSNWEDENRFLRTLTPVAAVRDMVAGVKTPNDISAHVRMAGGKEYEHLPYESVNNWGEEGHRQIAHWREKSHFAHFIKRIETLISQGKGRQIFLAADKPETYGEFQACFGDRLAMLNREVYDRSAEQLRYGLADVLLLGSSPLLLGSSWSSFSELAMRMAPHKMEIEMSGTDF